MQNVKTARLRLDGYTRLCLTLITILLTVLILGLWAEKKPFPREACGADQTQQPFLNSASQRDQMIKGQEDILHKLDELIRLLQSGQVKVQVEAPKEGEGGGKNVQPAK